MARALTARGIRVHGTSRPVEADDLARSDLILAMDSDNLANLRQLDSSGKYADRIRLFGEFCSKTPNADVPDPYYSGEEGFESVIDMIEDGVENLLEFLSSKLQGRRGAVVD